MSDNTLHMTMLFDFFGELLTAKQREYFDLYHNEDLSLSEIAEMAGISRQGVYDIIARAESTLTHFETKTGVVKKWNETKMQLEHAGNLTRQLQLVSGKDEQTTLLVSELTAILEGINNGI